jgi:hypothetical protein
MKNTPCYLVHIRVNLLLDTKVHRFNGLWRPIRYDIVRHMRQRATVCRRIESSPARVEATPGCQQLSSTTDVDAGPAGSCSSLLPMISRTTGACRLVRGSGTEVGRRSDCLRPIRNSNAIGHPWRRAGSTAWRNNPQRSGTSRSTTPASWRAPRRFVARPAAPGVETTSGSACRHAPCAPFGSLRTREWQAQAAYQQSWIGSAATYCRATDGIGIPSRRPV